MSSSTLEVLRQHLQVLKQVNTSALTEQSPLAPQPQHIKTPLRLHQLAGLHAMREKEHALRHTGLQVEGEQLFSDFGIIGDRVGVGKTLLTLGHISQMANEGLQPLSSTRKLHRSSTAHCFSFAEESATLYGNLIVVPHTIYRQWQDAIKNHTNLVPLFLKTQRDLDKDTLLHQLETSDCTLIANTLFPSLLQSLAAREIQPTWRRIFYDEADTIKLKSTCPQANAWMTWFITGTYTSFLFCNIYYHSYVARQLQDEFVNSLDQETKEYFLHFRDMMPSVSFFRVDSYSFFFRRLESRHPLRGYLVVRSAPAFLDMSVQLPPLHRSIVRCDAPLSHRLLALPSEAEQALHAGDIQSALQILGCNQHSTLTLVEAATAYRRKELERLQRLLEFKQSMEYSSPQAKEQAIASLEDKIHRLQEQLVAIEGRLNQLSKEDCSVCFSTAENPCVTPCCSRTFCGGCILEWLTRSTTCPLCRSTIHPNQLLALHSQPSKPLPAKKLKKMEALLQILEENPQGRFLIFSRFDNTFSTIQDTLGERFPISILQGNKDVVAHTIQNFENGHIRCLLMSSKTSAAGMNLQSATHIILLHRMHQDEEKQILGRAYRLGRDAPLYCVSLLHENE